MLKLKFKSALISFLAICCFIPAMGQSKKDKKQSMDKMWGDKTVSVDALKEGKGKLFDNSNFGMFIHWGLFSSLGDVWNNKTYYGIAEWIMNPRMAGIPVDEYKKLAGNFNPTEFDADSIAKLACDAGMKYIIITSKHHEGFAMFDSKYPFNIVDATPFARDPMKELSSACKKYGLGFGFYYSHNQDWTTPGGSGGPKVNEDGTPATFEHYFYTKCKPQVKEICSNYGDIDFVWFDTPGNMPKKFVMELAEMVRKLQPNAMLGSRIGYGMGDYASEGDMEVPTRNIPGLWETCDTNNDSWAYSWYDNNFKSPKQILNRLINTIGRGGTYLFNVGPDGKGKIPEIGAKFLRETGKWIKRYPKVIYGAGPSPWGHALPWGDITTHGKTLQLAVFDWPQDRKLYLPGLKSKIVSANLLENGKVLRKIKFTQKKGWVVFNVPFKPGDTPASVINVNIDCDANSAIVDSDFGIYPNVSTNLLTEFSTVTSAEKKEKRWMEKFGEWKHITQVSKWEKEGKTEWTVNVLNPGYYYIDLKYSGKDRLVWKITTDEGIKVQNQQAATEKYVNYPMGILEFKTAGKHKITVSLVDGNPENSSLQSALISPIQE